MKSMIFLSNYSCSPLPLIFKQFMSGFDEKIKKIDQKFKILDKPKTKINDEQNNAEKK